METASTSRPPWAATISAAPASSETKKAHWCETPRRRGFGSFWATPTAAAAALSRASRSCLPGRIAGGVESLARGVASDAGPVAGGVERLAGRLARLPKRVGPVVCLVGGHRTQDSLAA